MLRRVLPIAGAAAAAVAAHGPSSLSPSLVAADEQLVFSERRSPVEPDDYIMNSRETFTLLRDLITIVERMHTAEAGTQQKLLEDTRFLVREFLRERRIYTEQHLKVFQAVLLQQRPHLKESRTWNLLCIYMLREVAPAKPLNLFVFYSDLVDANRLLEQRRVFE
jgi:hypothetical protein